MLSGKGRFVRYLASAVGFAGAVIGWSSPSHAYIQQIVIDQTATVNYTPIPLGSSIPGPATSYTVYQGRIFGMLNPNNPLDAVITDLNLASPVSGGFSYISNFQIVTPTNPAQRSGLLIQEVPNRGGNAISTGSLIQGATYVQGGWQGDLLAQCAPAATAPLAPYPCFNLNSGPYGTLNTTTGAFTAASIANVNGNATLSSYVVQVPIATTDGNPPNGTNAISGPEYGHVCTGRNGCGLAVGSAPTSTAQSQVQAGVPTSPPASLDTNEAQFWTLTSQTESGVDSAKTVVPSTAWAFAYCPNGSSGAGYTPDVNWICLLNGATFNPNLLYELVYTGANPLVLGAGFAAFRDLASFLRYGTTAPGGGSNPIAGSISRAMTVGSSQSGAFIHGLIFYGFNEDENGRIVFDGAWPEIDGRMITMNYRWGQPENLMYLYMGGDEAPVWWADYPNMARNLPADGMLHRCTATGTCPQILETFGSAEMYSEKMAVALCGFTCAADIPLPSNVYRYYSPGATHGGGTISFNWTAPNKVTIPAGQAAPSSIIPETYTNNALQYAFIERLFNGTAMPPSVYPTLAAGQLVLNNQAAEGFPNVPGITFAGNKAWPPFVYNFGPGENYDQESGVPSIEPPAIGPGQGTCASGVCPVYVPPVNADGNETSAGLLTVLGQVPLASYVGWNVGTDGWYGPNESDGPGSIGQVFAGAGNSAGYYPFWDTIADRTTAGDPRLSLEERYGSNLGYKCEARVAVNVAFEQNYLLASDATLLLTGTSGSLTLAAPVKTSNVLASASPGFVPTLADTSLANEKCFRTDSHDFNGAGVSDILWHDTSGDVAMWLMTGGAVSSSAGVGNATTNWSVVGQRDFNGDGNADILWHDSSGDVAIWFMNGSSVVQSAGVGNANPAVWSIAGTGDFNGDGKGDILWRDASGDVAIWEMSGSTVLQSCGVGNAPTTWSIVGTGDFNGDGHSDILWRDTSGNVSVWFMNGCSVTQSSGIGNAPSTWSVAGTGDFNGDGKSDILWHDTSGDVAVWLMNGSTVLQSAGVGNAATVWSVAATGDFNGDGYSDILWQDTTGDVALWEMTGAQVIQSSGVGTAPSVWTVQGLGAD